MQTPVRIETDYWLLNGAVPVHLTYHLLNDQGVVVLTSGCPSTIRESGIYRASFTLPGQLLNSGDYVLKLMVFQNGSHLLFVHDSIATFTVSDVSGREGAWMGREPSVIQIPLRWDTERMSP